MNARCMWPGSQLSDVWLVRSVLSETEGIWGKKGESRPAAAQALECMQPLEASLSGREPGWDQLSPPSLQSFKTTEITHGYSLLLRNENVILEAVKSPPPPSPPQALPSLTVSPST